MTRVFVLLGLTQVGCHAAPDDKETETDSGGGGGEPIVVYWTIDTLGMRAADSTGACESLSAVFEEFGRDLGCLEGAVPLSTWTEESHVRTLWPQNQIGTLQGREFPAENQPSFLQTLAETRGLTYLFISDNATFARGDGEFDASWAQGADSAFVYQEFKGSIIAPEEETAVYAGIGDLLERSAHGEGLAVYINDFEAGGHGPRCVFDPYTDACNTLWEFAVEGGLVPPDADRAIAFFEQELAFNAAPFAIEAYGDNVAGLRGLYWDSIAETIEHFREERLEPRINRLLSGLEEQGRLDDLVLVLAGDHGENPCIPLDVSGEMNCAHFGLPNEWTARVPVFLSPAEVGVEWASLGYVGDAETPWALSNLAFAELDSQGVETPSDWPEPMEVGTAMSWHCHDGRLSGTRVLGDVSLRCEDAVCGAFDWAYPEDLTYAATELDAIPAELTPWAAPVNGKPNAFAAACSAVGGW